MDTIATDARMIRLDALVRLRRLGGWPWLVLAAWVAAAAAQEPRLLRGFGINLSWQAAWSGGAILLVALTALGPQRPGGRRGLRRSVITTLSSLTLVLVVGGAQAVLAWGADVALGPWSPLTLVPWHAAGFALVWLPTAVAGNGAFCHAGRGWSKLLLLLPVSFSLGGSALWFSGPTPALVLGCILATVGAGCIGALSPRSETAAAMPGRRIA